MSTTTSGVEPNDSPGQATPLGVAAGGSVYVWVNNNTFTATDTSDYFVFESGASDGTFMLGTSGLCYGGADITSMTATLWKVLAGAQVEPPVDTWTASGASGCVTGSTAITANTEYLLGVTMTGTAGSYGA